jgi:hypothetical protein
MSNMLQVRTPRRMHGYGTQTATVGEDYEWVCADCFAALGEQLHWRCVALIECNRPSWV